MTDAAAALEPAALTMKEAASRDRLGSAFIEELEQVHHHIGKVAYVVDWPYHHDPQLLHPALADEGLHTTTQDVELSLRVFDRSLGDSHREKALAQRARGLRAMLETTTGGPLHSLSEIAEMAYGFDPRKIAEITPEEHATYLQQIKSYLPEDVRPDSDDPEVIRQASADFNDTLRIPSLAAEDPTARENYVGSLERIIRERATALGIHLPNIKVQIEYPSDRGEDFFFTFSPEGSILRINMRSDAKKIPTPAAALRLLAHEMGHSLHLQTLYDNAKSSMHTEDAVYAPLGPQAISEGIAENLPRILFPDSNSYFDAIKQIYDEMEESVNEAHLRHIVEYAYNPDIDRTKLTLSERLTWDAYLTWERDTQELGDEEAGRRFVENFSQALFTSPETAQSRLAAMQAYGPYIFTYEFYRALVARELADAPDKAKKLLELCHWLPIAEDLPDDIF